ncbi:NAD(P)-binding domain-containing protein [uncultured Tateyamaria sp.]|uniref:flavin-containing monooxygenase n=1 Tax=uncultured Tateyamaria sp. TaxID=455651 RepID=UPI002629DF42|nr:NAD(P)-binding domain-containing protein [uncultured Tateyamaria sp.]
MAQVDRVAIIGAGPAGLATARALRIAGVPFTIFERHSDVGGIWDTENPGTPMYASAHFISSRTMSGHEGFPMPESYPDYPSNRQIVDYIRDFADCFDLHRDIRLSTSVDRVENTADGWKVKTTCVGETTDHVFRWLVCANGTNWEPNTPELPGQNSFTGTIQHAVTYKNSASLRDARVLVVGAGNSGVDIACDAAFASQQAYISMRRGYHFVPKHIFGMPADVFAATSKWMPMWMSQRSLGWVLRLLTGDLTRLGLQKPDHRPLESHPILNSQILHYLQHGDLIAKPDIARLSGDEVIFADGTCAVIDRIILATGYNWSLPYLDDDLFDWRNNRPQAYLKMFNPKHPTLFLNGFIETNSGIYKLLDEMGMLIAQTIRAQRAGGTEVQAVQSYIERPAPVLGGKVKYVNSARHTGYTNVDAYTAKMAEMRKHLHWDAPATFFARLPARPADKANPNRIAA